MATNMVASKASVVTKRVVGRGDATVHAVSPSFSYQPLNGYRRAQQPSPNPTGGRGLGLVARRTAGASLRPVRIQAVLVNDNQPRKQQRLSPVSLQENKGDLSQADEDYQEQRKLRSKERKERRAREQSTYLAVGLLATSGIGALAVVCTVARFTWHLDPGTPLPWLEVYMTLLLTVGAVVGMEFFAITAHKDLWHASWWEIPEKYRYEWNKPIWGLHKSHHEPRTHAYEANDIFAIINAVPAIALLAYGFWNNGVVPGMMYGTGLGITLYGMAYMFVHDGLVHKRFPVGPINDVPYFRKIAAAHRIHHTEEFEGVPWGLFLGPLELSRVGGTAFLEEKVAKEDERRAAAEKAALNPVARCDIQEYEEQKVK